MKTLTLLYVTLLFSISNYAQLSNTRPGNWGDSTIWSGNIIPTAEDDVILNFDIVVDVNASCFSFSSNGHLVTVNNGVNLVITGSAADTLLSRYVSIYTGNGDPTDTTTILDFTYDSLKRNIIIDSKYFSAAGLRSEYYTEFFYLGNKRLPFKKIRTTLFAAEPSLISNSTNFYSFQNDQLTADSTADTALASSYHYTYLPGKILRSHYYYGVNVPPVYTDSAMVEYLNGNITRQLGPVNYPALHDYSFVFDTHPNPFYNTQNKLIFEYTYPFYSAETFVEDVSAKNNATNIYELGYNIYSSNLVYEYRVNGYPKKVNFISTSGNGNGFYFYTH